MMFSPRWPKTLCRPPDIGSLLADDEAEQDVTDCVLLPGNAGPGGVEATGAVVKQCRVGHPGQQAQRRVALVTGRTDRVVALALRLKPASREVEVPALYLGLEQPPQCDRVWGRFLGGRSRAGRGVPALPE